jgi:hypothetical protein
MVNDSIFYKGFFAFGLDGGQQHHQQQDHPQSQQSR